MLYIPRTFRLQAAEEYFRIDNSWDESKHPRDARGRFSHTNRQKDFHQNSFYNPKTKLIELSGYELGVSDTEIRANALMYYKINLQGRRFDNSVLKGILFSRVGLDKLRTNSADISKLKAIPALKDILEKGMYVGVENLKHERRDGIIKFHRINHNVSIAGCIENMSILIGEDRNGNRFYNLNNKTYKVKNSSRENHAIGETEEEFSLNIINDSRAAFNPLSSL